MPRHHRRDPSFRYRRYEDDIVVLCVRWYISYRLSLRDLTEMMAKRRLVIYPSTGWRWVQRSVPEFEKRWDALRRPTGSSWRVDETYVRVRGKWHYLYRGSTSKVGRLTFCCGRTAASPPRRPSFGRLSQRITGTDHEK